jgi:hypothetical protein
LSKQVEGKLVSPSRTVHEWPLPLPDRLGAVQVASIKLPNADGYLAALARVARTAIS